MASNVSQCYGVLTNNRESVIELKNTQKNSFLLIATVGNKCKETAAGTGISGSLKRNKKLQQETPHKMGLSETPRCLIRKRCRYSSLEKLKI